jgi:beta-galactosidase
MRAQRRSAPRRQAPDASARADRAGRAVLDQAWGLIHYRTELSGRQSTTKLKITGLGDRALVFLDGKQIGALDRNQPDGAVDITADGGTSTLDLPADPSGRVNFGPGLNDPKGITGKVFLGDEELHNWEIRSLPLDE